MDSMIESILKKVDILKDLINAVLDHSKILRVNRNYSAEIVVVQPDYTWAKLDDEGRLAQDKALRYFAKLFESIDYLFEEKHKDLKHQVNEIKDAYRYWIERNKRGWDWGLPSDIQEVRADLDTKTEKLKELMEWLKGTSPSGYILIPDTNSLIMNPEINTYGQKIGLNSNNYYVVYIPTVLSELDRLKVVHRDDTFRKKVESVIKRIKGYRSQGNIHDGITVYETITVKMIAAEPNMNSTLPWLNSDNNDDRIVATCLELQREYAGSIVMLITADINLQNKAQMALLPFGEID